MTPVKRSRAVRCRVGDLLREWRRGRRLSQLDLALATAVSSRHLSFVETGRATASRGLLLRLAEQLDVSLRERNALLVAGGYAPLYTETSLDAPAMAHARAALGQLLKAHEPFPAVAVNLRWDVLLANRAAERLLAECVAPKLLVPPVNALRATLHPEGLACRIGNFGEYSAHLLTRVQRHLASVAVPDHALLALYREVRSYPGVQAPDTSGAEAGAPRLFVPLRLRALGGDLSLFSTIATFGTALDITLAELAVESFFPADPTTERALRAAARLPAAIASPPARRRVTLR